MKLISSLLFAVMVLTVSFVYGQETKLEKEKIIFSAKLYAVSSFNNGFVSRNHLEVPKSFSPTISWGRSYGNYNEVELTNFRFQKNGLAKGLELGARYSYNWRLFSKSETARLSYYIGLGAQVIYNNNSYSNEMFSITQGGCCGNYFSSSNRFNANFSIIPRINYRIGKRVYLDLNIPYDYYANSTSIKKIEEGQKFTNSNSTTFPNKFTVNVGVAIKF